MEDEARLSSSGDESDISDDINRSNGANRSQKSGVPGTCHSPSPMQQSSSTSENSSETHGSHQNLPARTAIGDGRSSDCKNDQIENENNDVHQHSGSKHQFDDNANDFGNEFVDDGLTMNAVHAEVYAAAKTLLHQLKLYCQATVHQKESGCRLLLFKMRRIIDALDPSNKDRPEVFFSYRSGPVLKAIFKGQPIILEDVNYPSAATTERLNSLLEPDSDFSLTEDVTIPEKDPADKQPISRNIAIPNGFVFISTFHSDGDGGSRSGNISSALRSRLTEIFIPAYEDAEIQMIFDMEFASRVSNESKTLTRVNTRGMGKLMQMKLDLQANYPASDVVSAGSVELPRLLNVVDFVCNHRASMPAMQRLALGIRLFLLQNFELQEIVRCFSRWDPENESKWKSFVRTPESVTWDLNKGAAENWQGLLSLHDANNDAVRFRDWDGVAPLK
eukprot:gene982-16_t